MRKNVESVWISIGAIFHQIVGGQSCISSNYAPWGSLETYQKCVTMSYFFVEMGKT